MTQTECREYRRMQKFRDVVGRWEARKLSQLEAAELLGCSERQFRRYRDRFEELGDDGLRDGRLGRSSARAIGGAELKRMLGLYWTLYRGWNVQHFHEYGVLNHNFSWGYTWTKTQLHAAGLVDRAKRRGAHRRKRERKPCEGMMLHQDGSTHARLLGQPNLDLIVTMDDATSTIYSAFLVEEEGTDSTFQGLLEVTLAQGLPCTFYTDRGTHYFTTPVAGEKVDKSHPTQVGRALRQLGVEHIAAYSPEARGRSERMFGTLQDRLAKELALAGISEIATANRWIRADYLPRHNARFTTIAALPETAFVTVADQSLLREAFCVETERVVARDNTVAYEKLKLQLPESPVRAHYVKCNVRVRAYPDGTLAVFHGPGRIGSYTGAGVLIKPPPPKAKRVPASPSVAACSTPSRRGLATPKREASPERRPTLTASPPAARRLPGRKGLDCAP